MCTLYCSRDGRARRVVDGTASWSFFLFSIKKTVGRCLLTSDSSCSRSWLPWLASEMRLLELWRWIVVLGVDVRLRVVGFRRQQKKYSPAIRIGRAADDPIEMPKMACLDRPGISPLLLELFASFLFVLSLLLLLSLLLPLLLGAPEPGVAGFSCQYPHPKGQNDEYDARAMTY